MVITCFTRPLNGWFLTWLVNVKIGVLTLITATIVRGSAIARSGILVLRLVLGVFRDGFAADFSRRVVLVWFAFDLPIR